MDPLAIYIHWPYCARICPYCDFNVYKKREDGTLVSAIIQDLADWRTRSGARDITSVHFGGGTPSLMTPTDIERILTTVHTLWGLPDAAEVALEANPTDAAEALWQGFGRAGINRLSLGVQSFDSNVLSRLGRDHDGDASAAALESALSIFRSVSMDLIFGHSRQTLAHLEGELTRALALGPQHISTYQLTIEPDTAFAKAVARGEDRTVDDDASGDLYDYVTSRLIGAGYNHYEVSNFAKDGHESRHNLAYWLGRDYVGVGPGAHGRITVGGVKTATIAAMKPNDYSNAVRDTGSGIAHEEPLSPTSRGDEYVMMGLRISDGLSLSHYRALSGQELPRDMIDKLASYDLLRIDGDRLYATASGRNVLNTISTKLLGG